MCLRSGHYIRLYDYNGDVSSVGHYIWLYDYLIMGGFLKLKLNKETLASNMTSMFGSDYY